MTGYEPIYWQLKPTREVKMLSNNRVGYAIWGPLSYHLLIRAFPDLRIGDVFRTQKLALGIDLVRVARVRAAKR